ncbi:MAG TPA: tetraacyldisaccharide 4'-kinase [Candidatus Methylomirabilis sp.]|nr:tetraacyldisaccharide 4'-kinase [Candidatus Methylomirabilis sp.]
MRVGDAVRAVAGDEHAPGGAGRALLRAGLRVASWGYGAVVVARTGAYGARLLPRHRVPCPVVSVGNLTAGGTGKTPCVISLARRLQERGWRPAVLLRGYGRRSGSGLLVASTGQGLLLSAEEAGDEASLLAGALSGVPVILGADRRRAAEVALRRCGADLCLLDDGYQHLRLHRDLDILLLDARCPFGNGALLPRGLLREPSGGTGRADLVILTRADQARDLDGVEGAVRRLNRRASLLRAVHRPVSLVRLADGSILPAQALAGQTVAALSAIGSPGGFEATLRGLGASVAAALRFPDHHRFRQEELERAGREGRMAGATLLVTTAKDRARGGLPARAGGLPLAVLEVEFVVTQGLEALEAALAELRREG